MDPEATVMDTEATVRSPALELRAAEAAVDDLGLPLARLPATALAELGLSASEGGPGSDRVVEVRGQRTTVCRAAPLADGDHLTGAVRLDVLVRDNAGVGVGDTVRLAPAAVRAAEEIVLVPGATTLHDQDPEQLRNLLVEIPVSAGDRLQLTPYLGCRLDLAVASTIPDGAVVARGHTRVVFGEARAETGRRPITYGDVGGLRPQLQRVREILELPLRFPEIFERLGIDAPKGVLLHGPPGCGKTLIARAVAHEIAASFYSVSGPEIVHQAYGESEAHLRRLFEQAAHSAPSIVFLDEIDAIAPARDKVQGEVEKRVVAQLLAVMDGLSRRGQVIVLAATNRPNALDPALRRPGRFDREIAIPVPGRAEREEILRLHSRSMPLADDVDLGHLAAVTHGFVGADLEALCREAAMSRLRRLLPELDLSLASIPRPALDTMEVARDDFTAALHEVQPSALREVAIEVPELGWGDVGGLDEVKARLTAVFEWPLRHGELFAAARVRSTRGILLHGPPGCGKTLLARALAAESGVNFLSVRGPEILSMWVGESEERLRELFRKARRASPSIVFFDEIDALFPSRHAASSSARTGERLVSQFLAELDGVEELRDVLVLGATNRPDLLDPALLRPDRFDEVIEIPPPDAPSRRAIFSVHLAGKPLAFAPDLDQLAAATDGWSGAQIAEAVRQAALRAVARVLATVEAPSPADLRVERADLEAALADIQPQGGGTT